VVVVVIVIKIVHVGIEVEYNTTYLFEIVEVLDIVRSASLGYCADRFRPCEVECVELRIWI